MADVRINEVTTDVNVADPTALLTPQVLARIVETVMHRLRDQQRDERLTAQERSLGAQRERESEPN